MALWALIKGDGCNLSCTAATFTHGRFPSLPVAAIALCLVPVAQVVPVAQAGAQAPAVAIDTMVGPIPAGSYHATGITLAPGYDVDDFDWSINPYVPGMEVSLSPGKTDTGRLAVESVRVLAGPHEGHYQLLATDKVTHAVVAQQSFDVIVPPAGGTAGPSWWQRAQNWDQNVSPWGSAISDPQHVDREVRRKDVRALVVFVETTDDAFAALAYDYGDLRDHLVAATDSVADYYREVSRHDPANNRQGYNIVATDFADCDPASAGSQPVNLGSQVLADFYTFQPEVLQTVSTRIEACLPPARQLSDYEHILMFYALEDAGQAFGQREPIDVKTGDNSITASVLFSIYKTRLNTSWGPLISHELGHNLDYMDHYQYIGSVPETRDRRADRWSLMDIPDPWPHLLMYYKMFSGWIRPYEVAVVNFQESSHLPYAQIFRLREAGEEPQGGEVSAVEVRLGEGHDYIFEYRRKRAVANAIGDTNPPIVDMVAGWEVIDQPRLDEIEALLGLKDRPSSLALLERRDPGTCSQTGGSCLFIGSCPCSPGANGVVDPNCAQTEKCVNFGDAHSTGRIRLPIFDATGARTDTNQNFSYARTGDTNLFEEDTGDATYPANFRAELLSTVSGVAELRITHAAQSKPNPSIRPWPSPAGNYRSPDISISNALDGTAEEGLLLRGAPNTISATIRNETPRSAPGVQVKFEAVDKNAGSGYGSAIDLGTVSVDIDDFDTAVATPPPWTVPIDMDGDDDLGIEDGRTHWCVRATVLPYEIPMSSPSVQEISIYDNIAQSNYEFKTSGSASPFDRFESYVAVNNPFPIEMVASLRVRQSNPLFRAYLDSRWRRVPPNGTTKFLFGVEYAEDDFTSSGGDPQTVDDFSGLGTQIDVEATLTPESGGVIPTSTATRDSQYRLGGASYTIEQGKSIDCNAMTLTRAGSTLIVNGDIRVAEDGSYAPLSSVVLIFYDHIGDVHTETVGPTDGDFSWSGPDQGWVKMLYYYVSSSGYDSCYGDIQYVP